MIIKEDHVSKQQCEALVLRAMTTIGKEGLYS
jgi:hypothetical protein